MATNRNPDLISAITTFLNANDIRYDVDDDHGIVRTIMSLDDVAAVPRVGVIFDVWDDAFFVNTQPFMHDSIVGQVDIHDLDQVSDAMIFITEANDRPAVHGHLRLDFSDGTVSSRTELYCGEFVPPTELIDFVFRASMFLWKLYGDEFENTLHNGKSPLAAVEDAFRAVRES